jgi:acetyltransferase-like isoleucine patch superfamily enzyme
MITCSKSNIHETVKIGNNVRIISDDITIGEGTEIGDGTTIIAYEKLVIGKFCKIRPNARFKARSIEIGDFFYSDDNPRPLVVGGGGAERPTAILKIGERCVMHDSFINVFMPVTIGDDVGLSPSSDIITHGCWENVLEGYGMKIGPVTIGNGSIIGYRAIILPNVRIGKNVNIGSGAVVTKDIPDNVIAAGVPARVISPNDYPKKLTLEEKKIVLWQIMLQYANLLKDKVDFEMEVERKRSELSPEYIEIHGIYNGEKFRIGYSDGMIVVEQGKKFIVMDPIYISWCGEDSEISDDVRDFLRHYGIRLFSRHMISIKSKIKRKLESM